MGSLFFSPRWNNEGAPSIISLFASLDPGTATMEVGFRLIGQKSAKKSKCQCDGDTANLKKIIRQVLIAPKTCQSRGSKPRKNITISLTKFGRF